MSGGRAAGPCEKFDPPGCRGYVSLPEGTGLFVDVDKRRWPKSLPIRATSTNGAARGSTPTAPWRTTKRPNASGDPFTGVATGATIKAFGDEPIQLSVSRFAIVTVVVRRMRRRVC